MKVRKVKKSDERQLQNLLVGFYKNRDKTISKKLLPFARYKSFEKTMKKIAGKYVRLEQKRTAIFVAEDNRKLVGYIYGEIKEKPEKVLDRIGYIEDWFVEEKYRSKGAGKLLWDELIKWFEKKKCNCLQLDTYTTNKIAIKIYHKFGFLDKTISMMKKLS